MEVEVRALGPQEVSQGDIYWALECGEEVTLSFEGGGVVRLEDAGVLTGERDRALAAGDLKRARAINAALIGLEAHLRTPGPRSLPRVLQIETTSLCNAECIMCRHYYSSNLGDRHVSKELFDRLVDVFPLVEGVVLHGYGEPLINPHLPSILRLLRSYGILVSTNTNLSVVPEGLFERYGDMFYSLQVSCDAASRELFEGIRKGLSFEAFEKNAMGLRDRLPGTRLVMAATIMRQNAHELAGIVELASRARFDAVTFIEMGPDMFTGNYIDMPSKNLRAVSGGVFLAIETGRRLGIEVIAPEEYKAPVPSDGSPEEGASYRRFASDGFQRRLKESYRENRLGIQEARKLSMGEDATRLFASEKTARGVCDWVVEKAYIDMDGGVYPCCLGFPQHSAPFGNIFETSFREIWTGERYREMRKVFYSGSLPASCGRCVFVADRSLGMLRADVVAGSPLKGIEENGEIKRFCEIRARLYESELAVKGDRL